MFVDIAGFTATTSRQSRQENADLIQTFGRVLLPLIKAYKGHLIKSIGDAYLITFRSPTDAMLCSMALQDAMHANNLNLIEEEKIHIRVAAHLGEVRVAKNDIFGEPVNVASRIEGVTPGDEIYLSEAVYMAMNKAEVPVEEVGFKQLAGVSQSVRLYYIPRFSIHRLVPEKRGEPELGSELVYPYGGMHYQLNNDTGFSLNFSQGIPLTKLILLVFAVLSLLFFISWYFQLISFNRLSEQRVILNHEISNNLTTEKIVENNPLENKTDELNRDEEEIVSVEQQDLTNSDLKNSEPTSSEISNSGQSQTELNQTESNLVESSPKESNLKNSEQVELVNPESIKAISKLADQKTQKTPVTPQKIESVKPVVIEKSIKAPPTKIKVQMPPPIVWNVRKAKQAYRDKSIDKPEYVKIIRDLKAVYSETINQIKLDYRNKKITKAEYKIAVTEAKLAYNGD